MTEVSTFKQSEFTYWYPIIGDLPEEKRIPTPDTIILKLSTPLKTQLWNALDGLATPESLDLSLIYSSLDAIGYPVFVRTEHGSGKHEFDRSCFLKSQSDVFRNLVALHEWSQCCDMMGRPFDYLIIRKYLTPIYGFKAFLGLPIAKEFRCFVKDGDFVCMHFYWPEDAIEEYNGYTLPDDWKQQLSALNHISDSDASLLKTYSERFGSVLPGNWSVDFMYSEEFGWVMIDAARAEHSWHPDSCIRQLFWRDE